MPFAEPITPFFADFGESATVGGSAVTGVFDTSTELAMDALLAEPSLLVPATTAAGSGTSVVVRGTSYIVRQVLDEPPDGVLRRLVLAKA